MNQGTDNVTKDARHAHNLHSQVKTAAESVPGSECCGQDAHDAVHVGHKTVQPSAAHSIDRHW